MPAEPPFLWAAAKASADKAAADRAAAEKAAAAAEKARAAAAAAAASSAFAAVDHEAAFKADIAPILEKSCANCHDPKKAKNGKVKAGFDSSSLKSIVKGGKEAGLAIHPEIIAAIAAPIIAITFLVISRRRRRRQKS